jgi:integrase
MGALYRRGQVWWCKYYVNGRPVRESTGVAGDTDTAPAEAKRFLKVKEGKAASGEPVLRRADRVRYEEAAADRRRHYETTGERDLAEADGRLAHLNRYFTGRRIAGIGPADLTAYAQRRQQAGAANGTINRELAVLGRMLRIAYRANKLTRLPVIEKLKEAGARQGFFEPAQYEAVRRHLPADVQVAVAIAYGYGWRMQSEVLTLERRQLDLKAATLRLDPGATKNDEGCIVSLPS